MGQRHPQYAPVQIFFALMAREDADFERAEDAIVAHYGAVFLRGETYAFDELTSYYQKEFGTGLRKRLVAAGPLVPAEQLVAIKNETNALEFELSGHGSARVVNIDPGYLNLSKVVLASTKDHWHRLYVADGIFEEITLKYKRPPGAYVPMEWTYPDYRQPTQLEFFQQLREQYRAQIVP
jgi:hypothetical protein